MEVTIIILSAFGLTQLFMSKERNTGIGYIVLIQSLFILTNIFKLMGQIWWLKYLPLNHWTFLPGPFLYYYLQGAIGKKFKKSQLIHLIPFFFWYFVMIFPGKQMSVPLRINTIYGLTTLLSFGTYSIIILKIIDNHRKQIKEELSYSDFYLELKWLKYIMIALLLLTVFLSISIPVNRIIQGDLHMQSGRGRFNSLPDSVSKIHDAGSVIFLFFFTLFSLEQNRVKPVKLQVKRSDKQDRAENGTDSKEFEAIIDYMNSSKIYLDSQMSLQLLCDAMGRKRNDVSRIINYVTGENFFSFVNGFRAREFKKAMEENRYPAFTVLSVGLECGFNSQSSFYEGIKKEFGVTPAKLGKNLKKEL